MPRPPFGEADSRTTRRDLCGAPSGPPGRLVGVLAVCLIAGASAGCGWTPRDEFLMRRSIVLTPEPADPGAAEQPLLITSAPEE